MKQVPDMFDEDFMLSFLNDKDKLKEVSMSLPLACTYAIQKQTACGKGI